LSSTDKTTFKVLLCVAILQNRADLILSAIRHTLKAKISDIEVKIEMECKSSTFHVLNVNAFHFIMSLPSMFLLDF